MSHAAEYRWYLWAECKSCKAQIPVMETVPPPFPDMQFDRNVFVFHGVRCPHCNAVHDYRARELRREQEPGAA
jgi:hypothetical protein